MESRGNGDEPAQPRDNRVVAVGCGSSHTIALLGKDYHLRSKGLGMHQYRSGQEGGCFYLGGEQKDCWILQLPQRVVCLLLLRAESASMFTFLLHIDNRGLSTDRGLSSIVKL